MITDATLLLSGVNTPGTAISGQAALPVSGTPVLSTNTIDLSVARDIGEGNDLYAMFTILTAYNNLTSLQLEIIGATNAALSAGVITIGSVTILQASLTANSQFALRLNANIGSLGVRYIGARYTTVGTTPTTGSVLCDIVADIQDGKKFYASGFLSA